MYSPEGRLRIKSMSEKPARAAIDFVTLFEDGAERRFFAKKLDAPIESAGYPRPERTTPSPFPDCRQRRTLRGVDGELSAQRIKVAPNKRAPILMMGATGAGRVAEVFQPDFVRRIPEPCFQAVGRVS